MCEITPVSLADSSPMMSHVAPMHIKECLHYTSSPLLSSGSHFVCVLSVKCVCLAKKKENNGEHKAAIQIVCIAMSTLYNDFIICVLL